MPPVVSPPSAFDLVFKELQKLRKKRDAINVRVAHLETVCDGLSTDGELFEETGTVSESNSKSKTK